MWGDISRASLYPMFGNDLIRSAVTAKAVKEGEIEELKVPENPLDVLAQVLLSMCCTREWDLDELYLFMTSVWMWHTLPPPALRPGDGDAERSLQRYPDRRAETPAEYRQGEKESPGPGRGPSV